MPLTRTARTWLQRAGALALLLLAIPAMLAAATLTDDAPVVEGEPSPRTVVATELVRLVDETATELAKRAASESVEPVVVFDDEASAAVVAEVRNVFAQVAAARRPVAPPATPATVDEDGNPVPAATPTPVVPTADEQLATLLDEVPELGAQALAALVALDDTQLAQVEAETLAIAQRLARQRIGQDDLTTVVEQQLVAELAVAVLPEGLGELVVAPLIRAVVRPTVLVDPDATAAARQRAEAEVQDVVVTWRRGDIIVRTGDVVTPLQAQALRQTGLQGTDPARAIVAALVLMAIATAAGVVWIRVSQPRTWASGRHVLLLASLLTGFSILLVGVYLLADAAGPAWWYLVPSGPLAVLAALLIAPPVGIATVVPAVLLTLLMAPEHPAAALYAAVAIMLSVPLVSPFPSLSPFRRSTLRMFVAYPLVALSAEGVLGGGDDFLVAAAAGAAGGVGAALVIQGVLPFLESVFRLPTITALLDLAARDHPLLRELEHKALGSYQHSVMVASLVERACRAIGANALLGSVAALYHDIGKVRQPHFFIENQQGIANPHDEMEPEISAIIIQNHVVDGVELARTYRLPPEVVAAIGSHHGTMLVSYFYNKAVVAAEGDPRLVDEHKFRYPGRKPHRKEAAVLFIADSCEAATRAAAMKRGTLPREEIEATVDRLIQERLDDDQLADADLTLRELTIVRNQIVEALVGVYHPRIDYPQGELPQRRGAVAKPAASVAGEAGQRAGDADGIVGPRGT